MVLAEKKDRCEAVSLRIGKSTIGRLLGFGLLLGNAERALHAACNATDRTTSDTADSTPDWSCRLTPFSRSLACSLLSATNDTLRISHLRYCQNGENSGNDPSRFHVLSPRIISSQPDYSGKESLSPACPLWVKSGHMQCKATCPLNPRKRTFVDVIIFAVQR